MASFDASIGSYTYIAEHFPNLWIIENDDYNKNFYDRYIKGAGHLASDFVNYYGGFVKMGDTPSLLYMMNGNPCDPAGESWGGSFEPISQSPYTVFSRNTTVKDTVAVYSVIEYQFEGPVLNDSQIGKKISRRSPITDSPSATCKIS